MDLLISASGALLNHVDQRFVNFDSSNFYAESEIKALLIDSGFLSLVITQLHVSSGNIDFLCSS